MLDVRAVVKLGQHAQEAEPADGTPADEFDESIGRIGLRGDQHGAAGVFAVVEGEKEAAARVPIFVVITTERERAAAKLRYSDEDAEKIADWT